MMAVHGHQGHEVLAANVPIYSELHYDVGNYHTQRGNNGTSSALGRAGGDREKESILGGAANRGFTVALGNFCSF